MSSGVVKDHYFLYEIKFPSGKSYIGMTDNAQRRWAEHKGNAIRGHESAVCCALRKYGLSAAVFRILACGNRMYIATLEVLAIAHFGTRSPGGYNISYGGDLSPALAMEVREKIRASKLLHWADPAYREFISKANIGRVMTPEQNARNAEAKRRNWQDPEYRARLVAAHTGKKQSQQTLNKRAVSLRASWTNPSRREASVTAMSGRRWINDGREHRQILPHEDIPAGWTQGMLKRKTV